MESSRNKIDQLEHELNSIYQRLEIRRDMSVEDFRKKLDAVVREEIRKTLVTAAWCSLGLVWVYFVCWVAVGNATQNWGILNIFQ